jgi:dihydrofolate synthase/folylpolyglutamate synthase
MRFLEAMGWVEEQHSFPKNTADFHAHRFSELARRSGLFARMPPLIVVTGSCGKASTARFLAFMLRAAGLRVGLGSKPPLQESPHGNLERYQLVDSRGEHWLDPDLFARICEPLPALVKTLPPDLGPVAPYDLRSWILLRAFQEWGVDIGIVEANIGLRDDPAGAIPKVALTVITPIATDHAQMLLAPPQWQHLGPAAGPLWHKLSAVPSQRVVVGRQNHISEKHLDALLDRAGPRFGTDFALSEVRSGLWGGNGLLQHKNGSLRLQLSCLGDFQVENAATAAMAVFELGMMDESAILAGARDCQIPGRLQVLGRQPLELLCVASSQAKVQAMLEALEPLFESPTSGMVMVLTLLDRIHGKQEVVDYLARHPRLRTLIVTQGQYHDDSRDLPPAEVAALARQANPHLKVLTDNDPGSAIAKGKSVVASDGLLLLLGNGLAAFASQAGG